MKGFRVRFSGLRVYIYIYMQIQGNVLGSIRDVWGCAGMYKDMGAYYLGIYRDVGSTYFIGMYMDM